MMSTTEPVISESTGLKPLKPVKASDKSASDRAVEYDGYLLPHKDTIQSRYSFLDENTIF